MQGMVMIGWFILGLFQMVATIAGIKIWLGVGTFVAVVISLVFGGLPLIGTVLGMVGAHHGWGWSWMQAGLLFFGPFLVLVALASVTEN